MKNKPLKVQPAKRVYQPRYPSYAAPNPLLHPETLPYPFTQKFVQWATTGGLAGLVFLGGQDLQAQTRQDSLYNPFPLENARVPYTPVSFGTGMPERLSSTEAIQIIQKAFADAGIQLEERVWLDDEIGVYLTGYSPKDSIGFLFMDWSNMDRSFARGGTSQFVPIPMVLNLNTFIKRQERSQNSAFERFLRDKDQYRERVPLIWNMGIKEQFKTSLKALPAEKSSEAAFKAYWLAHELNQQRKQNLSRKGLPKEIFDHIDKRFDDSQEKLAMLTYPFYFNTRDSYSPEYVAAMTAAFKRLTQIKSDKKFIQQLNIVAGWLRYYTGRSSLQDNTFYQAIKLEVMQNHPISSWPKHKHLLDDFAPSVHVSLAEARQIDQKNKSGQQFIAPISLRDDLMVLPMTYYHMSEELEKEQAALTQEYNEKNGMTPEIFARKREELKAVSKKTEYTIIKDLPRTQRDSLYKIASKERAAIRDKYKAMEQMTEEEKAAFQPRFDELNERVKAWRETQLIKDRQQVLRKLEEEVKMYIQWARSQMGN